VRLVAARMIDLRSAWHIQSKPAMQRFRLMSCLFLSLVAGMSLAACDGVDEAESPEGRSCTLAAEAVACADTELVSYCSYETDWEAAEGVGNLAQGPCIAPEDNECEPGEAKTEPGDPGDEICGDREFTCQPVEGIPMWVEIPCNTPLVLVFDDKPVEMIDAESTPMATFDISMRGEGSCITTDWPTAATPWLVVDRDGNGSIDGGHELFGSGTRLRDGAPAQHGFAALAEFDHNHDGRVDAHDPEFAKLMLWRDHDADRLSSPTELEPLRSAGVEQLAVDFDVRRECDERGNCGTARAPFAFAGGVGEIVDLVLSCQ
jgi:hypothetical protein